MNLQTQISQQQATIRSLEKLLGAKRCTQAELDQAKRKLADLEEQLNFRPIAQPQARPVKAVVEVEPVATGRILEGDEYNSMQADLSKQADQLNKRMAELSNKLHLVPPTVSCPELVKPILDLKAQIETIWDKKRYLERNRFLPEERTHGEVDAPVLEPVQTDATQLQLVYDKRRLIDKRSKLKTKLKDPKASEKKRLEWETELLKTDLAIQEIEIKLG
ncbi:hypothetical protein M0L20_13640 [Spirosoma sp. RP8]|uniref:Uncharacterized protein n=1 Tax=Spirosoma liriopis TaxID=2937440 RepID=A0ABT0HMV6_9BACT|nr:hypothetical protein [Spirosoma liriopis]MCK8492905.1 hypothetical protein [Spirosoma liriopis]